MRRRWGSWVGKARKFCQGRKLFSGLYGRLAIGLVLVVGLEIGVHDIRDTAVGDAFATTLQDIVLRSMEGHPTDAPGAAGLAFIDIDDASFTAWTDNGVTDRGKLRDLIALASNAHARLVIVDIDLTDPRRDDGELIDWLRDYPATGPHVIFFHRLGPRRPDAGGNWPKPLPLALDQVVAANPRIHLAPAAFITDPDGRIRRWRLYERVCDGGRLYRLPSIELLSIALLDEDAGAKMLAMLPGWHGDSPCNEATPGWTGRLRLQNYGDLELDPAVHADEVIPFVYRWRGQPDEMMGNDLIAYRPALRLLQPNADTAFARDRIVMIGASNAATNDFALTPLGPMPGALVLLNAIDALQRQGQLREPARWQEFALGAGLGFAVWVTLYLFHFAVAPILITVLVGSTVWVLSALLYTRGVLLDMTVPVVAAMVHYLFEIPSVLLHDIREYKWRGVLAQHFHRRHLLVPLAALLAAARPARAAPGPHAGVVKDFGGDESRIKVWRDGQDVGMRWGMDLYAGDRIEISGDAWLELAPDIGRLTADGSPHVLQAAAGSRPTGGVLGGIGYIIFGYVRERRLYEGAGKGADGPLSAPLLTAGGTQFLTAGRSDFSDFAIGWSGGQPDYQVSVNGSAGGLPAITAGKERRLVAAMRLRPGHYVVTLRDRTGTSRIGDVEIVDRLPPVAAGTNATVPDALRPVAEAIALSRAEGGHWRLEAYRRLTGTGLHVADVLAARLADGQRIDGNT
jgi:CHASE2 domain-containing sensor protein